MSIFAMSDIHGMYEPFMKRLEQLNNMPSFKSGEDKLILLGDYIDIGKNSFLVLKTIYELQRKMGEQLIVLLGNHERLFLEDQREMDKDIIAWLKKLPLFYETDKQIFVHAGVDEEAEDLWKVGTFREMFTDKYPASTGAFIKDIVAGHVSSSSLKGDPDFHGIFWDGESHYYIDGIDSYAFDVQEKDRVIPLLMYDNSIGNYYSITEDGRKEKINV